MEENQTSDLLTSANQPETPAVTPTTQSVTPPTETLQPETPHGSKVKYLLFAIIALFVLTAGIMLLLLHQTPNQKTQQVVVKPTAIVTPLPRVTPVTAKNADQTLNTTDTDIQQALNQVDADTTSLNQNNPNQDTNTDL